MPLKKIWKERQTVTIVTFFETYENVAITNISIPAPESGTAFKPEISFKEVNVVKLTTIIALASVKVGKMDSNKAKQASPTADLGKQTGGA